MCTARFRICSAALTAALVVCGCGQIEEQTDDAVRNIEQGLEQSIEEAEKSLEEAERELGNFGDGEAEEPAEEAEESP